MTELQGKLGRLEAVVESLQKSILSLAETTDKQITNLATSTERQIETLANNISKLTEFHISNQRTNWTQIWSAAAVVLILISSLVAGFVLKPADEMRSDINDIKIALNTHTIDGHPESVIQKINHTKTHLDKLNERFDFSQNYTWETIVPEYSVLKSKINTLEHSFEQLGLLTHEERLISLERLIFPDTKYREGRP